MSALDRTRLDMAIKADFATFIHMVFQTVVSGREFLPNWHINAMAYQLACCVSGETRRLVINLPPRNLKSLCTSVALPAWILAHDPTKRIICLSYSAELAAQHSRESKAVMESTWYKRNFPETRISREKNTETFFQTRQRGFRFATSIEGTLTGIGGDFIVVDDPLNSGDAYSEAKRNRANDWFDSVAYSRLDDKRTGSIIVAAQRLHMDDLTGHVLQTPGWNQLSLPAIADIEEKIQIGPDKVHIRHPGDLLHEEREAKAVLDRLRVELGSHRFSAQYQQCPIPESGEIIKWEWFQFYDELPKKQWGDKIIQSWDTALRAGTYNDYSVCLTFLVRGDDYYLIHVYRQKLNYPELKNAIISLADRAHASAYIIEDKGSGTSVIDDIRHSKYANIARPFAYTPVGDKTSRMMGQSAKIEEGRVHLPRSAPWLRAFHDEVLQFPHAPHDDQVDALAQFLDWVDQRERNRVRIVPLAAFGIG
jgi:predicted phage terminase large subunit-like protein